MRRKLHHFNNLTLTSKFSLLVAVLLFITIFLTVGDALNRQEPRTHAAGVSPMLFGVNLTLTDATDQFLTSAATRTMMQQMHVQTVRMPIRSVGAPSAAEIQAAQDIKAINAIPLVILKFSQADPAGAGVSVVQAMNTIFGSSTVYYEFGNERDLSGTSQTAYTTAWNQYVPKIKAAAPNGKFGGPVNFQTNPAYIAYFVQNATPKPDFISWHEYTCGNGTAAATCVANITHWSKHITDTKSAIQATGNTVPPIFITEWNYDPNNPSPDSRVTPQFQQQFVTTALQELAKDGVTAAYQFVVTGHTEYNLVDPSGQMTPAGQAFQQSFTQLGGSSNSSTPGSTVPTTPMGMPTPTSPLSPQPTFVCGGSTNSICPTLTPTPMPSGMVMPGTPIPTTSTMPVPSISLSGIPLPIPSPTTNGSAVCSDSSKKSCSYTDNCQGTANGTLCEKQVNGCGRSSSGNNIYICKNNKWVYDHWVKQGRGDCSFCSGTPSSKDHRQAEDLLNQLIDLIKQLMELINQLLGNNPGGTTPSPIPSIMPSTMPSIAMTPSSAISTPTTTMQMGQSPMPSTMPSTMPSASPSNTATISGTLSTTSFFNSLLNIPNSIMTFFLNFFNTAKTH